MSRDLKQNLLQSSRSIRQTEFGFALIGSWEKYVIWYSFKKINPHNKQKKGIQNSSIDDSEDAHCLSIRDSYKKFSVLRMRQDLTEQVPCYYAGDTVWGIPGLIGCQQVIGPGTSTSLGLWFYVFIRI